MNFGEYLGPLMDPIRQADGQVPRYATRTESSSRAAGRRRLPHGNSISFSRSSKPQSDGVIGADVQSIGREIEQIWFSNPG